MRDYTYMKIFVCIIGLLASIITGLVSSTNYDKGMSVASLCLVICLLLDFTTDRKRIKKRRAIFDIVASFLIIAGLIVTVL